MPKHPKATNTNKNSNTDEYTRRTSLLYITPIRPYADAAGVFFIAKKT